MALAFLRQIIERPLDDDVIWTWPVDGPPMTPGLLGALIDRFQVAWSAWADPGAFSPLSWTLLEALPAGGGPATAVQTVSPPFALGSGVAGPQEVQLALSREIIGTRGQTPAGRVFLGPISSPRCVRLPDTVVINQLLNFAVALHASWLVENTELVVISKQAGGVPIAPVARPIVAYSIDNAWDTQRRRGTAPTARTTVLV